jgi:hypothetical protein
MEEPSVLFYMLLLKLMNSFLSGGFLRRKERLDRAGSGISTLFIPLIRRIVIF